MRGTKKCRTSTLIRNFILYKKGLLIFTRISHVFRDSIKIEYACIFKAFSQYESRLLKSEKEFGALKSKTSDIYDFLSQ